MQTLFFLLSLPKNTIIWLIKIYQKTISPDHGLFKFRFPHGYCHFYPSCSQYAVEVIQKRGLLVGLPKTVWRILRCNPWNKGGVDLPR
ncbi:MAG: membrane protein insertion efficiency factor YidD [Candidatus Magasanikbacteria bacterium]|nr:membrane protein insertion efficiency factor YidD [Candidatus Magasanikbacteria bacterium]